MAKRKPSPAVELETMTKELQTAFADWKTVYENGCNDPFWADGTNLNLIRNHIIYYKGKIEELCREFHFKAPSVFSKETPVKVSEDFLAADGKYCAMERLERLRRFKNPPKREVPVQLCLF